MSQLTNKEIRQLGELGREILEGLSCDINDMGGFPCRSHRFAVINSMVRYLLIHNLTSTLEQCEDGEDVDSWWKRVNENGIIVKEKGNDYQKN